MGNAPVAVNIPRHSAENVDELGNTLLVSGWARFTDTDRKVVEVQHYFYERVLQKSSRVNIRPPSAPTSRPPAQQLVAQSAEQQATSTCVPWPRDRTRTESMVEP